MDVDFGAIATVAWVGFVAAVGVVLIYTLGLRLLGTGQPTAPGGDHTAYRQETPRSGKTPPVALAGAAVCFAVCGAAVLTGIWLTIPQFH
uniref:Uncharacterized protein n=1 Tax=Neobacillus citreus TaxID=2833578 RepID=A0A942SZ01_9BACI